MQFLVITGRSTDFPSSAWTPELLESEAQHVRGLYRAGTVRTIWRRVDKPGAVLLFEANSETEVRDLVSSFPLAKLGMLTNFITTQLNPHPVFGSSERACD